MADAKPAEEKKATNAKKGKGKNKKQNNKISFFLKKICNSNIVLIL